MPNPWRLEDDAESEDDDEIWLKRSLASNSAYLALLNTGGAEGAGSKAAAAAAAHEQQQQQQRRIGDSFTSASLQRSIELRKNGVDELWVLSPTAVLQQTQGMEHVEYRVEWHNAIINVATRTPCVCVCVYFIECLRSEAEEDSTSGNVSERTSSSPHFSRSDRAENAEVRPGLVAEPLRCSVQQQQHSNAHTFHRLSLSNVSKSDVRKPFIYDWHQISHVDLIHRQGLRSPPLVFDFVEVRCFEPMVDASAYVVDRTYNGGAERSAILSSVASAILGDAAGALSVLSPQTQRPQVSVQVSCHLSDAWANLTPLSAA